MIKMRDIADHATIATAVGSSATGKKVAGMHAYLPESGRLPGETAMEHTARLRLQKRGIDNRLLVNAAETKAGMSKKKIKRKEISPKMTRKSQNMTKIVQI